MVQETSLDYNENNQTWILRVPRDKNGIRSLMTEHGLDFSPSASSAESATLFTQDPYAAASFAQYATPRAAQPLSAILVEIEASWKATSQAYYAVPEDKELWEFQKADIEYALRRRNTLVGDQPGLGKTEIGRASC